MSQFIALSIVLAASAPAAFSADEASLDSMWMDQKSGGSDTAGATNSKTPAQQTKRPAPATETADAASASDTVAPMCTVDTFKSSALVSKGGWPGVGPFKPSADTPNEFVDGNQNKIKIELTGDQITYAELILSGKQARQTTQKDLLAVEMHIDFLLEACGIKPKKIEGLNEQLGKNKDALLRDQTPVAMTAGRCQVTVQPQTGEAGAAGYVIAVNSLDANKSVIKEHSSLSEELPKKHGGNDSVTTFIMPDATKPSSTKQPPAKATTVVANKSALKDQFAEVINEWQRVKKGAVRNKQIDDLSTILSGKALARQTDAIKWLQTNKKYYDMTPKAVVVDQFSELATGKKYMVSAQVHEAYKYIDEPTGKVLKEVDDVNKVNYTIEKIDDKWVITDSALLSTATKTSSANKGSH